MAAETLIFDGDNSFIMKIPYRIRSEECEIDPNSRTSPEGEGWHGSKVNSSPKRQLVTFCQWENAINIFQGIARRNFINSMYTRDHKLLPKETLGGTTEPSWGDKV